MTDQLATTLIFRTRKSNPFSTSGWVQLGDDPSEPLYHYKQGKTAGVVEREAVELQRAADATRHVSGIHPVPVKMFDADQRLLITERLAPVQSLFNYAWNQSRWWTRRPFSALAPDELGRRLGQWLRAYHDTTRREVDDVQTHVRRVANSALSKLDEIQQFEPGFLSPTLAEWIRRGLLDAPESCAAWGLHDVCQVHGDLDLANLLVTPDGVVHVIDFADTREGAAWEDLARLWHALWGIGRLAWMRRGQVRAILDNLLTAYGVDAAILNQPLFVFLRRFNAITQIIVTIEHGRKFGLSGHWVARRLAKTNRRWLAESFS